MMAAPKGNKFWKHRASQGRDRIFESPEILWSACQEYLESVDNRKWNKIEFHGKDANKCTVPNETPYTKSGLCLFLDIDFQTWENYRSKPAYKDFFEVTTRVELIIETQQFEGATVGAFNANIISRKLGLADKQEVTVEEQPLFPDVK